MRITKVNEIKDLISKQSLDILCNYNIRHVEHLASILASPYGQIAIRELKLKNINKLSKEVNKYIGHKFHGLTLNSPYKKAQNTEFSLLSTIEHSTGYQSPIKQNELNFNSYLPSNIVKRFNIVTNKDNSLPNKHCIFKNEDLPNPGNQENRGTCVAFTLTALLEGLILSGKIKHNRSTNYSEQYLFFRAKQRDINNTSDGTTFTCGLEALLEYGVCASSYLKYIGTHDWGHAYLFKKLKRQLSEIDKYAKVNKIAKCESLHEDDIINKIKKNIKENKPVGIGVYIFRDAWYNGFTQLTGEVMLPITIKERHNKIKLQDECLGGHAIALYGYCDNEDSDESPRPGGGYFIFRNSWGSNWAHGNNTVDTGGYGNIPYDYVAKYFIDACVINKLANGDD